MKRTVHYPNGLACAVLALLLLPGAAAALEEPGSGPESADERAEGDQALPKTFGSSDIKDWYAPDSRTLIIDTYGHGRFKATLTGGCTGIRSAQTLGFTTGGSFELDRSTTVVLPDGARCGFSDLIVVPAEDRPAGD